MFISLLCIFLLAPFLIATAGGSGQGDSSTISITLRLQRYGGSHDQRRDGVRCIPTYEVNILPTRTQVDSHISTEQHDTLYSIHDTPDVIATYLRNCSTVYPSDTTTDIPKSFAVVFHLLPGIHSLNGQTLLLHHTVTSIHGIPVTIEYRGSPTLDTKISGGYVIPQWLPYSSSNTVGIVMGKIGLPSNNPAVYTRQLYINNIRMNMTMENPAMYGLSPAQNMLITSDGILVDPAYTSLLLNSQFTLPGLVELISSHSFQQSRCTVMNYTVYTNQSMLITMAQPCWSWGRSLNQVGIPSSIYNAVLPNNLPLGAWTRDNQGTIYYAPRSTDEYNGLVNNSIQGIIPEIDTLMVIANTANYVFSNLSFQYSGYSVDYNISNGYIERYGGVQYLPCLSTMNCFNATLSPAAGCGSENCWLEMQHSAVRILNSSGITLNGLQIQHIGLHGIGIFQGSNNINVSESIFDDLSGGGLHVGNVNETQTTNAPDQNRNIYITDNVFTNLGLEYQGSIAVSTFSTINAQILHNFVYNTPYTAFSFNWPVPQTTSYSNFNLLNGNKASQSCYWGSDGGSLHTIGPSLNTFISENYFYNQSGGHAAIYIDNTSDYYNITSNVIDLADMWLYFQQTCNPQNRSQCGNAGHDNHAWDCYARNAPPSPFPYDSNNCTVSNITYVNGTVWPAEAQTIIDNAGPRAGTRYYSYYPRTTG